VHANGVGGRASSARACLHRQLWRQRPKQRDDLRLARRKCKVEGPLAAGLSCGRVGASVEKEPSHGHVAALRGGVQVGGAVDCRSPHVRQRQQALDKWQAARQAGGVQCVPAR